MDTGSPLKGHWLKGLAPAGRLDIDSKGLLVLTQDGQLARHIIGPQSDLEKEYLVWVASGLTPERSERLRHGLELDGRALKVAKVEFVDNRHFRMTLIEGRKRQIRRMCELVGLKVTGIRRVRVGPIQLGKLKEGTWRLLTPEEKVKLGNS